MNDEFLSNLANMDTGELRTAYSDLTQSKYGRGFMLDPGLTDDQIRDEIKSVVHDKIPVEDEYLDVEHHAEGLPESVVRIIVAEGAALKLSGLLDSYELNYEAIEEVVHDDALRSMLSESDVTASRDEVVAMIAAMDPNEVSSSDYIDDDSGEVLLTYGQKAGSSRYHPSHKNVTKPSWYMDDHDHDEDEEDLQGQYQSAIETYAADFAGESYDDPEGMAPDAAEGFFALHPEWKTWSIELRISRSDMKSQIAELIHSQMMGEGLQLEAEYRGRKVPLGKPMKGDTAKFKVYVKDKKTGNVKKVNFGSKGMEIRRDNPKARKSFRARHGCGTKRSSDRTKAAWWSCRMWSTKPVSDIIGGK